MIATEAHRPISSFREAVEDWNKRSLTGGYRSSYAPTMICVQCAELGMMLTTIHGQTTASCYECGHRWTI